MSALSKEASEELLGADDVARILKLSTIRTRALLNKWDASSGGKLLSRRDGRMYTTRARLAEFLPGLVRRGGIREVTEVEFKRAPERVLDWCTTGQVVITLEDGRRALLTMASACNDAPSAWLPTTDASADMPDPEFGEDGHIAPIMGHTIARGDLDHGGLV